MPFQPLVALLASQSFFTISDFVARMRLRNRRFAKPALVQPWFIGFEALRIMGTFLQLYVFAHIELGKSMALFGASSIVLSNALGLLFLKEVLSARAYFGILLAVFAFLVVGL